MYDKGRTVLVQIILRIKFLSAITSPEIFGRADGRLPRCSLQTANVRCLSHRTSREWGLQLHPVGRVAATEAHAVFGEKFGIVPTGILSNLTLT